MSAERVSDLTIDEFKALIRQTMQEVLEETGLSNYDEDEGAFFKPEVAAYLQDALNNPQPGIASIDVMYELGLDPTWIPTKSTTPQGP